MTRSALLSLLLFTHIAQADTSQLSLVDVHVHYKWNQAEVTSARQAVQILREHNIERAVVIGMPAELALELEREDPSRIIPVWSPYTRPGDWSEWAFDRRVPERARQALAGGAYRGIGELHLIGGFTPHWSTPVISALAELAIEYRVPLLLHTELSRTGYLKTFCAAYPRLRILWAHAGAVLQPDQVADVLVSCPALSAELSARDPWRFVNNPVSDSEGQLLEDWRQLIERFPLRFMLGSDPVWPVDNLDSWDRVDSGWQQYGRFIGFHRDLLQQLKPQTARRLARENALQFFASPATPSQQP